MVGSVSPRISIQMLGRFAVWRGDEELPTRAFGGQLAQQLLRMLALSRGALLSKDVAAEGLWPTSPPADAPGNVEILISRIRRALADRSLVETCPRGYTLVGDDRCWVDTEALLGAVMRGQAELRNNPFGALSTFRSALALWRGDPLAEDALAQWAQEPRDHLWRARLDALEGAATAALATGDTTSAVRWAMAASRQEPLREAATMLLVQALASSGDQAAALVAFDAFRRRLADELGVDPSAEALRLRQRLLRGEIRTGAVTIIPTTQVAALPAGPREVLALLVLMGRPTPASILAAARGRDLRSALDELDWLSRSGLAEGGVEGWAVSASAADHIDADSFDPSERTRLHLLLAQVLQLDGADYAEIADHLVAGGDQPAAATAYAVAAGVRLGQTTDEEALRLAATGLELSAQGSVRATLLEVRGEARRRRGQLGQAREDLERALSEITRGSDRSRTLARLAILEARSRNAIRGGELIELAIAEAGDDPAARGQALAAGAIIDLTLEKLDRAQRRFGQAQALLELAGDINGTVRLLYWRGMARFIAGRPAEAAVELDHLVRLHITAGEVLRLCNPRAALGHALVFMAEPIAGLAEIDEALAWARAVGHPVVQSASLWRRSEALAALGHHADAVDSAQAALDIASRIEHAECTTAALRGLGISWQAAGSLERAEDAFRGSLRTASALPLFASWATARLGLVLVAQGRLTEAEPLIESVLDHSSPLTRHEARWAQAELLHARGDDTAPEVADTAMKAARASRYLALVPRLAELAQI